MRSPSVSFFHPPAESQRYLVPVSKYSDVTNWYSAVTTCLCTSSFLLRSLRSSRIMKVVGRPCSICCRSDREEIDRALESGESLRSIGARFGISSSSLQRHKVGHLRKTVSQPGEPVSEIDQPAQAVLSSGAVPVVAPPQPALEASEPGWPSQPATVSALGPPQEPVRPLEAPEPSATQKYSGGPLPPCPVCGSTKWRLRTDGSSCCSECHPLPLSPGTYAHVAPSASGQLGVAKPTIGTGISSAPNRVPTALSSL